MRNSSILKWAQNNKTNKLLANGKNEKGNNKNWIHSPDALLKGHVAYLVKFLGNTEVDKPKGIEVVKQGIQKLKFSQQLKKSEGSKTPKVELTISVDGVAIQEPKTKEILHQYPLHKISYCADDKAEKRFFSFIAKEGDTDKHTCFVFVSDKLAEEITLTIGQAFELAYKKFLDTSGKDLEMKKQLLILQKRIAILENENSELKKRLKDVAAIKGHADVTEYCKNNGIKDLCSVRDPPNSSSDESICASSTTSGGVREEESSGMTTTSPSTTGGGVSSSVSLPRKSDDELICLDGGGSGSGDGVNKLDGLSLDDLNDDDFNPRATDSSDDLDDFNPRSVEQSSPAPPKLPALPPRDPSKINQAANNINNNNNNSNSSSNGFSNNNPFSNPPATTTTTTTLPPPSSKIDPFGMTAFDNLVSASTKKTLDGFEAGLTMGNFSLDELDPLKN